MASGVNGQRTQPYARTRWTAVVGSVVAGLVAGVLGTALHGHAIHLGAGVLPVGAAGALLLLAAASLLVGLWGGSGWFTVLSGAVAYVCVGILSIPRGGYGLVAMNVQGMVWLYGIAGVTPLAALLCFVLLRRTQPRR